MKPQVFIVFLRRPRKGDARRDPFWEFGSFGCTRCHRHNLLNPSRCRIRDGDRLAFVQGGPLGCRLLLVTPPVRRVLHQPKHGDEVIEIRWRPAARPFSYSRSAPLLAGGTELGGTGFPRLEAAISNAARSTLAGKLASCFRARSTALENDVAEEITKAFSRAYRNAPTSARIKVYTDALPWFDQDAVSLDRRRVYQGLLKDLSRLRTPLQNRSCGKSRHAPCRP